MEIVVLLKQVPSTESAIEIADDGVSIKTTDIKWVINPYDEFAVEEALRIREAHGGTVIIVSVGPEKAAEAIRTALAIGADKGILIHDPQSENRSSLSTAMILKAALENIPFDLIIAGQRAIDDDNYQVGLAVAEYLKIPQISFVTKVEILDQKIRCHRSTEGGSVVLEAPLPTLFTTQRGLNEPRYASLPGIMKAKKKPLDIKSIESLGLDPARLEKFRFKLLKLNLPPQRGQGVIVEGETPEEKAALLSKFLHEDAKVI